jgi:hypothetical protein
LHTHFSTLFRYLFILLAVLILNAKLKAQEPSMIHYTIEDGLPSNTIYGICQDSKGFMWFATDQGVSQFDGHGFRNFSIKDGLPDNEVFSVKEDSYQRLWLVSYNDQPAYIFNEKVYNTNNDLLCDTLEKLGVSYFQVIKTKLKHDFFFGRHFCILSKDKVRLIRNNVSSGLGFGGRIVWHGQEYFIIGPTIYPLLKEKLGKGIYIHSQMAVLFHDKLYAYYADTNYRHYLIRYGMNDTSIVPESEKHIPFKTFNLAEFENEIICLTEKGIRRFNAVNGNFLSLPQFPQQEPINNFFIDKEKNIWITSLTNGIYLYPDNKSDRYTITSGLKHSNVLSVSVQNGIIFSGYNDGSFDQISGSRISNTRVFKAGQINAIRTVLHAGNNRFLVGTDKGIFNLEQGMLTVIGNSAYKDGLLKNGYYLLGLPYGAIRYDIKNRSTKEIYNKRVTAITEDTSGRVWFGTLAGVTHFRKRKYASLQQGSYAE